jgi:hypothetical protein
VLCLLVSLAGKPFIRALANEELYNQGQEAIAQLLQGLGRLLTSPSPKVMSRRFSGPLTPWLL